MRSPVCPRTAGTEFNMTPMIDVVFLLIIFFLVSSHLASQEVPRDLNLPQASSARQAADRTGRRITIEVLPDGNIVHAGDRIDRAELDRRLRQEANRAGHDLEIRIRCDRSAPYGTIEPVLVACAQAGIWNVHFSVVRRKEPW
ncbi:MAG: ExbD/TolR family protein [Pirellulales bacterium]